MIQILLKSILIGCSVLMLGIVTDITFQTQLIIEDVQARAQPVRPRHAAVARHTSRRVVRSTRVYVRTLPRYCTTVVIDAASYYYCGTTYYRSYGSRYVVVVID